MSRITGNHEGGDAGASAVEYGLLVAGIAAVILAVVFALGTNIRDTLFTTSCAALQSEIAGTSSDECT